MGLSFRAILPSAELLGFAGMHELPRLPHLLCRDPLATEQMRTAKVPERDVALRAACWPRDQPSQPSQVAHVEHM